jgi:beta-carotene ketolase (CrtO type)
VADATYDAIVVGGGHQGLITACYLAWAGLEVMVLERQHELGGGAAGESLPTPAFIQNPCAHFSRFYGHPAYEDFGLHEHGLEYVYPEQGEGMVYDDGTAFVGYSALRVVNTATGRAELDQSRVARTEAEIRRFSAADAAFYSESLERYLGSWRQAFQEYRFTAPPPPGEPDPLERLTLDPSSGLEHVHELMTSQQCAYDLFESDELRTLFMRGVMTSTACYPGDVIGLYVLLHTLGLVLSFEPTAIPIGGTYAITNALLRAYLSMGGDYRVHAPVARLLLENGRAAGVRMADGSELRARACVVSDLNVQQTILGLLGAEHVSDRIVRRVKNVSYDRGQLYWGNFALHELPSYAGTAVSADATLTPRLNWGPKDPDAFATRHQAEIFTRGYPEKIVAIAAPDSIWDSTRAPEGCHTILLEQFAPPLRFFSERDWLRLKREIVDVFCEQWSWYAPNLTPENVIAAHVTTPYDVANRNANMVQGGWVQEAMSASQSGRFRPIPELSGYRMPAPGFYLCSSAAHSGAGIGRGSGYVCYKTIAEDCGLRRIWEEKDRAY